MLISELKNAPDVAKRVLGQEFPLDDKTQTITKKSFYRPVKDLMQKYGLELIGDGKYGMLFAVPGKDYVLKIYSKDDTPYTEWVGFCKANAGNHWLPQFKGKVIDLSTNLNAVRMERLDPYRGGEDGANDMYSLLMSYSMIKMAGPSSTYYKKAEARFPGAMDDDSFQIVSDFSKANKSRVDMHAGNLMMRGDQVVITDPLANL